MQAHCNHRKLSCLVSGFITRIALVMSMHSWQYVLISNIYITSRTMCYFSEGVMFKFNYHTACVAGYGGSVKAVECPGSERIQSTLFFFLLNYLSRYCF